MIRYPHQNLLMGPSDAPFNLRPRYPSGHSDEGISSDVLDGPAAEEWTFKETNHTNLILTGLNDLRSSGTFCDVTIKAEGEAFPAHKCVLSAASSYFKAMFSCNLAESQQESITINGVEPLVLRLLIDYMYTSEVVITKSNVQNLLSGSNLLEVLPVRDACCQFLDKHMDDSNCLGIQSYAEAHACADLQQRAKAYSLKHFAKIIHNDEFTTINESQLIELISNDDLEVEKEEDVFHAVLSWLEADVPKREREFHKVLAHVRLALLSPYFLHDCVQSYTVISQSTDCMRIVEEARLYHLLPDRRAKFVSERTRPRRNAGAVDVIVSVGGEDDKVVLRSVEYWDPLTHAWTQLNCLPFAVSKHGLVVSGQNKMFMAGGEYPDMTASRALWRYDPVFDLWQELASMNTARSELGLAILDGNLYAVGGWEGSSRLASVERYDQEINQWANIASLKMAVTSPAVVAHEGCLYVCGGAILEDGDGIELVQKYDTKMSEWTEVAGMLIPRSGSAACVLDGYIYVIGGWHASTENTNKVERYDIQRNIWTFVAPMHEKRYRPGVAVLSGRIFVLGGEEGWDRYHDTIEAYDPVTDVWETVGEMSSSRSWLACCGITLKKK